MNGKFFGGNLVRGHRNSQHKGSKSRNVSFAPSGLAWFPLPRACALGCILSPLRG